MGGCWHRTGNYLSLVSTGIMWVNVCQVRRQVLLRPDWIELARAEGRHGGTLAQHHCSIAVFHALMIFDAIPYDSATFY